MAVVAAGADVLCRLTYANTALAGSAVLYLVYVWFRPEAVGRAASTLAAGGALGVVAALAIDHLGPDAHQAGLVEVTALLSAGAVIAYLAMERVYRNRSAGVVVMPAVMIAVLCEMWLISKGLSAGGRPAKGLGSYWEAGHRFAFCLGYCAIAVTAAIGVFALLASRTVEPARARAMRAALSVGAPLLVLGAGMGAVWSIFDAWAPRSAAAEVGMSWLVAAVALAVWARMRRVDDPALPRYAIAPFALATVGLLLSRPAFGLG